MPRLSEAEATLKAGGDCFFGPGENNVTESFKTNFGDASSFALQILATIYASTGVAAISLTIFEVCCLQKKSMRVTPQWREYFSLSFLPATPLARSWNP